LKSYPPGVPSDIDPSIYASVVALLEESFAKFREQRAYVCMDKAIIFGDIDALSTNCPRPMSARSCSASCATVW
jgi:long-chain acyl-CoA synthetase